MIKLFKRVYSKRSFYGGFYTLVLIHLNVSLTHDEINLKLSDIFRYIQ